jgi:hypothetical protein
LVFDANGLPVPQAQVKITAATTPTVNLDLMTADDGRLILPGAPVCNTCYKVTVTKTGYSTDRTYSLEEIANPAKADISILKGQVSEVSFAIDKLSTLTIYSVQDLAHNFAPLPNQNFILTGEKILGKDVNDDPVMKYEKTLTTDSTGKTILSDLEWDNYHFSLIDTTYDLAANNPLQPWVILPDKTYSATFSLTAHTPNSLWLIFKDSDSNLLASVSAQLSAAPDFQASGSSGLSDKPNFGQIFFTNLQSQVYQLTATASGFLDYLSNITVSGQTQEQIMMNKP